MSVVDDHTHAEGTMSPARPSSSWTLDSVFADSAISVRTPAPLNKDTDPFESDEASSEVDIAQRLNGLMSEIWAVEQDGGIQGEKRRRITHAVDEIEAALERDSRSSQGSDADSTRPQSPAVSIPVPSTVTENDLEAVQASLTATVESMRMRQQEQRHLQQLTVEKLEAVAQRCIQQEGRLRKFAEEVANLQEDNQTINQENQVLHVQLHDAQSECAKREVAVNAMSSAVTGLEGYVNGTPSPAGPTSSRRIVTRGRGRFRGRYYADEPVETPAEDGPEATSDGKALHEGVTAWLRGFRDVEEELRTVQGPAKSGRAIQLKGAPGVTEDDWGDFQTRTSTSSTVR